MSEIQNFKGKYPRQLWPLFFSEMWERFCFYGMRGMLIIFMVSMLGMAEKEANLKYGATQAFVYAMTFIGGLFADKILGFRKSLYFGGILMIVGSLLLAIDPRGLFFEGIAFTIIGTGYFKPNISTMVGLLYREDDPRRDAGFSMFYAAINIGALIGGYLCVGIGKGVLFTSWVPSHLTWNVAFGLASIVMVISLLTFTQTQKIMGDIGKSPMQDLPSRTKYEWLTYLGSLAIIPIIMILVSNTKYTDLFMYTIGPLTLLYLAYEMKKLTLHENKKLIVALVLIFFSIVFWAFFEQSGGSLSLFAANHLTSSVAGLSLDPNGVNNSANSLFVILFASLLGMVWYWLSKKGHEPSSMMKFVFAFLSLSAGFYIFYLNKNFSDSNGVTSLTLFTIGWFVITLGELCLSPIGMSSMTKLSPNHLQGVMMGMWFLASAYGQYFAGILGAKIASASENAGGYQKMLVYTQGYKQLAIYGVIAGVALWAISFLLRDRSKTMYD